LTVRRRCDSALGVANMSSFGSLEREKDKSATCRRYREGKRRNRGGSKKRPTGKDEKGFLIADGKPSAIRGKKKSIAEKGK